MNDFDTNNLNLNNLNTFSDVEDFLLEEGIRDDLEIKGDDEGRPYVIVHFIPSDVSEGLIETFGGYTITGFDAVIPL